MSGDSWRRRRPLGLFVVRPAASSLRCGCRPPIVLVVVVRSRRRRPTSASSSAASSSRASSALGPAMSCVWSSSATSAGPSLGHRSVGPSRSAVDSLAGDTSTASTSTGTTSTGTHRRPAVAATSAATTAESGASAPAGRALARSWARRSASWRCHDAVAEHLERTRVRRGRPEWPAPAAAATTNRTTPMSTKCRGERDDDPGGRGERRPVRTRERRRTRHGKARTDLGRFTVDGQDTTRWCVRRRLPERAGARHGGTARVRPHRRGQDAGVTPAAAQHHGEPPAKVSVQVGHLDCRSGRRRSGAGRSRPTTAPRRRSCCRARRSPAGRAGPPSAVLDGDAARTRARPCRSESASGPSRSTSGSSTTRARRRGSCKRTRRPLCKASDPSVPLADRRSGCRRRARRSC